MKYIICYFLLFITKHSFAQSNTQIQARAIYQFSHVRDTTNIANVYTEKMMLDFTENEAVYKSYASFYSDSVMTAQIRNGSYDYNKTMQIPRATPQQEYYFFTNNIHTTIYPWIGSKLSIKSNVDTLNWGIKNEHKNIAGFNCTKAIGNIKGREYEVWFCNEIAVKAGPWKLNGLPGLILEGKDKTGYIKFELISLYNIAKQAIVLPENTKDVSEKEFLVMKEAVMQNPMGFMNAALGTSNGGNSKNVTLESSNPQKKRVAINNPIELGN